MHTDAQRSPAHSPCPSAGELSRSTRRSRNRKRHTCHPARARSCRWSPPCALSPWAGRCRSPRSACSRWNSLRPSALRTAAPTGIIKRGYRLLPRLSSQDFARDSSLSHPLPPSLLPPSYLSSPVAGSPAHFVIPHPLRREHRYGAGSIDMVDNKVPRNDKTFAVFVMGILYGECKSPCSPPPLLFSSKAREDEVLQFRSEFQGFREIFSGRRFTPRDVRPADLIKE